MIRLTAEAHAAVREVLGTGEIAVDATAGNGWDTQFLADCVGPTGRVLAIDIQHDAVERTLRLCERFPHVQGFCGNHADLRSLIPAECHGFIGAIMFNLGYLPNGDHAITTRPDSTIPAIEAAYQLLRPGGIMTIIAYPGHPGGREELRAVRDTLGKTLLRELTPPGVNAPTLFVVRREMNGRVCRPNV